MLLNNIMKRISNESTFIDLLNCIEVIIKLMIQKKLQEKQLVQTIQPMGNYPFSIQKEFSSFGIICIIRHTKSLDVANFRRLEKKFPVNFKAYARRKYVSCKPKFRKLDQERVKMSCA